MKKIFIVVGVIILVLFVGVYFKNRLEARYANNPLALMQDSIALSSDKTKADMLDKASKMRYTSLSYQAKKHKQESGSYVGFCKLPFVTGDNGYSKIDNLFCNESLNAYVVSGSITSGNYLCVDDSDVIRKLDRSLSVGEVKCPATAPIAR